MPELALPSYVLSALSQLADHGFKGYAVGGCVRDLLIGRPVHDFDICTNATPDEMQVVFSGFRTIPTGLKHGTLTVLIEGMPLEITTFRSDGTYSDGRHPDAVSFTARLADDLSRRDFTVNAMAYHPKEGIIDPFGGQKDLSLRCIRCVGDPKIRFTEDALRILRAIRFAAILDFTVDPQTQDAAVRLRERLDLISRERVREELCKLLIGRSAFRVLMENTSILTQILPELTPTVAYDQSNPHHDFTLYEHLMRTVTSLPQDPILRVAGLLHDVGKPSTRSMDDRNIAHYYSHAAKSAEIAEEILHRLRFSGHETKYITKLIRYHDGVIDATPKAVKRRLQQFGFEGFDALLSLQYADRLSQKRIPSKDILERDQKLREIASEVQTGGSCFTLSSLAVNGHDMMSLGLRGQDIGKALAFLLEAVMSGDCENEPGALRNYLEVMPLSYQNQDTDAVP